MTESCAEDLINKNEKFDDNFDVLHELGRGRFAVVKKCVCKKTGKTFAAKCIKKSRTNTQGRSGRQQLLLEIDILNQSNHPKLVRLFDVYETRTEMQLILELAAGGDLHRHCIEGDIQRTEKEICYLIRQITEAIRYLHDLSIVHLDLKPDNILLAKECEIFPEIRLIDFGLSRRLNVPYSQFDIVGTPEYVAPEVLSYEPIDYGSDMWSIGVVTYVLLTGISPFAGDDVMETYSNIGMVDYDFDCEEFDDISDAAIDFIEKLLVRSPKKRMSSREALEHEWLKQLDGGITAEDVAHAHQAQQAPIGDINIMADTPLVEDNYSSSSESENVLEKSTEELDKTAEQAVEKPDLTNDESEKPIVQDASVRDQGDSDDISKENKPSKPDDQESESKKETEVAELPKPKAEDKIKESASSKEPEKNPVTDTSKSLSENHSVSVSKKDDAQPREKKEPLKQKISEKFSPFLKKSENNKGDTSHQKSTKPTTDESASKSKSLAAKFESKLSHNDMNKSSSPKVKPAVFSKSKSEDNATVENSASSSPKPSDSKLSSIEQKKLAFNMKSKDGEEKSPKHKPAKSAPTTPITTGAPSPVGSTKSSRSNSPSEFRKTDSPAIEKAGSKSDKQSSPSVKRTASPSLKISKDDEKNGDKASPKVNRSSIRGKIPGGIAAKMANKFSSPGSSSNNSPKQKSKFEQKNSPRVEEKHNVIIDNNKKVETKEKTTKTTLDENKNEKAAGRASINNSPVAGNSPALTKKPKDLNITNEKTESKPGKDIVFSMTLGGSLSPTGKKLQIGPLVSCAAAAANKNSSQAANKEAVEYEAIDNGEDMEMEMDENRDKVPLKMKMGVGGSIKLGIGKPAIRRASDLPQLPSAAEDKKKPKMKDLRGKSQSLSRRRSSTVEGSPNSPRKNYRRLYVTKVRNSKIFDPEFSIDSSAAAQIMQRVDNDVLKVEVRLKSTDLKLLP